MTDDDRHGIGGNQPPEWITPPTVERAQALIANANKWLSARPSITDDEMAGAAQVFIEQLRACRDDMEESLDKDCESLKAALTLIRMIYREPQELVGISLDHMVDLATDWLLRERDRLAAEQRERERLAHEAALHAADMAAMAERPGASVQVIAEAKRAGAKATLLAKEARAKFQRAQIKGDLASKAMSLRATWRARITDPDTALRHYADNQAVREATLDAITTVASREAKAAKDASAAPPGVEFVAEERAQ